MKLEDVISARELDDLLNEEFQHYQNDREEGRTFSQMLGESLGDEYCKVLTKHQSSVDLKQDSGMFRMLSYINEILKRKIVS
jgi:hypothetical protein